MQSNTAGDGKMLDAGPKVGSQSRQEWSRSDESNPRKRMGRGRLVSIDGRVRYGHDAETNPEASFSSDQRLTEISLVSANSDSTRVILDGRTEAAERLEHIYASIPEQHLKTLRAVLPVVESGDSLRHTAAKAGIHAPQITRAFEAARRADSVEFFKSHRSSRPIFDKPYDPKGVPMDVYNRLPGESTLSYFQPDLRSNVGVDVVRPTPTSIHETAAEVDQRLPAIDASLAPVPDDPRRFPAVGGCVHSERKWTVISYGYLALKCQNCSSELIQKYAFSREA